MADDAPEEVGFLLIDGFALMSYASAIEPLRAANLLSGRPLYTWRHFAPGGGVARSSTLAETPCEDPAVADLERLSRLIVVAGGAVEAFDHKATFALLRRLSQRGVILGGVSGGPVVLARAGVMRGRRMTVHWEHAAALAEAFPELALSRALYVIDRDRMTCAGGVAALDMSYALIAAAHGRDLASRVADWFLQTEVRPGPAPQRAGAAERYGVHHPCVAAALELMETHIADPLPREELARLSGLSVRQLDRQFKAKLGRGVGAVYRDMRLDRARELLRRSTLSVTEIAYATGFSGGGHFSGLYRRKFGASPSADRM